MKYTILLSHNEDTKQVELEEQTRFVRSILEALGIPLDFWNSAEPLSLETKLKLRGVLNEYQIIILDDNDGKIEIYHEHNVIAVWHKCEYVLKQDLSQIDPNKKLYLEMRVNTQSIFDEEE